MNVQQFGAYLKSLREAKGLTLTQLGDRIGYSNPYLSQIETGKKKNMPSPELLEKLVEPLGVEYADLMAAAGYRKLADTHKYRQAFQDLLDILGIDLEEIAQALPSIPRTALKRLEHEYRPFFGDDFEITPDTLQALLQQDPPKVEIYKLIGQLESMAGQIRTIEADAEKTDTQTLEHLYDIGKSLQYVSGLHYNGHLLTDQDRERILGMLKLLFPQYEEQAND
ncbi:helix-turn-helix domain-containing protein [Paenibacillus elgii]